MYLESITDGRRLTELGKASPKPIVVHKSNISSLSRVIAQSHTDALANDDQVVDAALAQAGIMRFREMHSYLDFVKVLQIPRMKGRNLGIVSTVGRARCYGCGCGLSSRIQFAAFHRQIPGRNPEARTRGCHPFG